MERRAVGVVGVFSLTYLLLQVHGEADLFFGLLFLIIRWSLFI